MIPSASFHRAARLTVALAACLACVLARALPAHAAWPSLRDVVDRSRAGALGVRDATGQVGIARAAQLGARESIVHNPYLEVIAQRGRFTEDVQVAAELHVPVEVAGQRGARIDEADAYVRWRLGEREAAQARAAADAIASYGATLVASARVREAARGEAEARAEAEYYRARLVAGDTTVVDASLADAELARWVQLRSEAELGLSRAREQLESALAGEAVDLPPVDASAAPPVLRDAGGQPFVARVVGSAPAVRALALEATFWDRSRERSTAERSPPVSVILAGGRGDFGETRVGGGLAWTFPVARRSVGEIARAAAERDRASEVRAATERVVAARAQRLQESYVLALHAIADLEATGVPAEERVVAATVEAVRAGKLELVRAFIARRDLAAMRGRRLDLASYAWSLYGEMAALTGDLP